MGCLSAILAPIFSGLILLSEQRTVAVNIHFHKSFWEAECTNEQELDRLLERIKHEGYQGSELFLPFYDINATSTLTAHRRHGLNIITGIATDGTTASEHLSSRSADNLYNSWL